VFIIIEYTTGSSPEGPDARRTFYKQVHFARIFCDLSSPGKDLTQVLQPY
jgi:hypothetical protein